MEVAGVVLAFTVRLVYGFRQNDSATVAGVFAMPPGILNANLNNMRFLGRNVAFGDREAPIPGFHLDAMIGDAQPHRETESFCKPISSRGGVRVYENWNYTARWNRPIKSHDKTLAFERLKICH